MWKRLEVCSLHAMFMYCVALYGCYSHLPINAGCPALIRIDYGTENEPIGTTHIMFQLQHSDVLSGANSIHYGKSSANVVGVPCCA